MSGTLYICATPIGNLEDISLRVLKTLKEADIIAAEDTRHTLKLLNRFEIKNELTSYHEHNKHIKGAKLTELLKQGKNIALVTDAGMPGISDPGCDIISLCRAENIPVTVIPGATAFTSALVLSGMDTSCFAFFGFLPTANQKKIKTAEKIKNFPGTAILYEAPHHLAATLKFLAETIGNRKAAIVREITKIHEEVKFFNLSDAAAYYGENAAKGEFVIVIEAGNAAEIPPQGTENESKLSELSVTEHVAFYENKGNTKKDAMKLAAKDRGVSKSEIYGEILKERNT
ncbi:MAG: 16S rRNA (cytidine(1402)-2'-O)-methyltransferase [Clostridiales bacterium]|jgi:16S rRNA (cytidine1402-2'-O)-methyltransferase|nr:16S rRNA (cytidine(1402)-2'-O)-methyltransferase [Clostridiales bacterium]